VIVDQVGNAKLGHLLDDLITVRLRIDVLAVEKLGADAQVSTTADGIGQPLLATGRDRSALVQLQDLRPLCHSSPF
jgi:hypothetical protein